MQSGNTFSNTTINFTRKCNSVRIALIVVGSIKSVYLHVYVTSIYCTRSLEITTKDVIKLKIRWYIVGSQKCLSSKYTMERLYKIHNNASFKFLFHFIITFWEKLKYFSYWSHIIFCIMKGNILKLKIFKRSQKYFCYNSGTRHKGIQK